MPPQPADLATLHRRNNRESAELWQRFEGHRARVTALALSEVPADGAGTLAVLGAGNCNDLDLAAIAQRFAEVHLVDLDEEALARARARQPPEVAAKLVLHAPVDLSGHFDRLGRFKATPATPVELANLPRLSLERARAALPGQFDVVMSTCFLSQLMQSAYIALGPAAPAAAPDRLRAGIGPRAPGGGAVAPGRRRPPGDRRGHHRDLSAGRAVGAAAAASAAGGAGAEGERVLGHGPLVPPAHPGHRRPGGAAAGRARPGWSSPGCGRSPRSAVTWCTRCRSSAPVTR